MVTERVEPELPVKCPATFLLSACLATPLLAQSGAVTLTERFEPGSRSRVELKIELSGDLASPTKAGGRIDLTGTSFLRYDERVLPSDDRDGAAVLRLYRDVSFTRTIGGETQRQEIRPAVRRMVVLRSNEGKKAPFSPDGPLTFGEIDAVRVDLFSPVLVQGMLPASAVKPGDTWTVSNASAFDLTGLDRIESGKLTAEYLGPVTVSGNVRHRISITGTVKGLSEDGPTTQAIDATAYFDPEAKRLAYLSLKGTQELLDGSGKVVGRLTGRFTMTRSESTSEELGDAAVSRLALKPTSENSRLLYENPSLRLRFVHPRNWRVGAVQGRQVTVEDPKAGAGILITVEPDDKTPTAADYAKEAREFLVNQKAKLIAMDPPQKSGDWERFRIDAELNGEMIRMEYAVRNERGLGGITVAARLPAKQIRPLTDDLDAMLKELVRTKP